MHNAVAGRAWQPYCAVSSAEVEESEMGFTQRHSRGFLGQRRMRAAYLLTWVKRHFPRGSLIVIAAECATKWQEEAEAAA